jgi:hypothetical protein
MAVVFETHKEGTKRMSDTEAQVFKDKHNVLIVKLYERLAKTVIEDYEKHGMDCIVDWDSDNLKMHLEPTKD